MSIAEWVSARDVRRARPAIRRLLDKLGPDDPTIFEALEWLRRLGLYRDGYRAVLERVELAGSRDTYTNNGKLLLWSARFMHLLGANEFAARQVGALRLQDARDFHFAGSICLAQWSFDRAVELYRKSIALESKPTARDARICRLGLADALVGLGRVEEALKIIEDEPGLSGPLDAAAQSVLLSCRGEYYARAGQFVKATSVLEEAVARLPTEDASTDRVVLEKWLGLSYAKSGRREAGIVLLRRAVSLLRKLYFREEAIFDILHLLEELGELPEVDSSRMRHFPGLPPHLIQKLGRPNELRLGSENNEIFLDLGSDEYRLNEQWRFGISMELRLLAWLRLAGDWGINRMRLLNLLWSEEFHALFQLEKRLEQLLIRLRKNYHLVVLSEGGKVFLDRASWQKVGVWAGSLSEPRILRQRTEQLTRADVETFYALKRTGAFAALKKLKS